MISQHEARSRVATGTAHLDATRHGWFAQIDLLKLEMQSPCRCIVGQLSHAPAGALFSENVRRLFPVSADLDSYAGVRFGVDVGPCESRESYAVLQDAWIEAIEARLMASVPVAARELVTA